jgi:hypothetical protein
MTFRYRHLIFRYVKLTLRQVQCIFRLLNLIFPWRVLSRKARKERSVGSIPVLICSQPHLTTDLGNSEQLNKLKVLGHGQNLIF